MPGHRVICTTQDPPNTAHEAAHIVLVGTGTTPDRYSKTWTVQEVHEAIARGDTFYTESPTTGARARVNPWSCRTCGRQTLRSSADAVKDNNLDNLPRCA